MEIITTFQMDSLLPTFFSQATSCCIASFLSHKYFSPNSEILIGFYLPLEKRPGYQSHTNVFQHSISAIPFTFPAYLRNSPTLLIPPRTPACSQGKLFCSLEPPFTLIPTHPNSVLLGFKI